MGVPAQEALGAVRLSLGRCSTSSDIQDLVHGLPPLLEPLLQEALWIAA
jgi:cysteine desulfurase